MPMRFPGQYADIESGYRYNYFRDYDPSLGRYVESDPIGLRGALNSFGYSAQSPIIFFDPVGNSPTSDGSIIDGSLKWSVGLQGGASVGISKVLKVKVELEAIRTAPLSFGDSMQNGNHLEQGIKIGAEVAGVDVTILSVHRETFDSLHWNPVQFDPPSVEGVLFDGKDVHATLDLEAIFGLNLDVNLSQTGRNIGREVAYFIYATSECEKGT